MSDVKPSPPKRVKNSALDRELVRVREEGYQDGLKRGRQDLLDWLQDRYLNPTSRPDRGSEEGKAILELAKEAAIHVRKLEGK